jgi:hypothetical protein
LRDQEKKLLKQRGEIRFRADDNKS